MSKSAASPTARLLSQSRLFSIPRALPSAELSRDWATGPGTNVSNTATAPFPTRQALETPVQSQARGDWGLKRNLPRKRTTKAGSPTVRVISQDTNDHVINFESASDHERTLAKFHEMNLPVFRSFRQPTSFSTNFGLDDDSSGSVYEDSFDNTDPVKSTQRWKYVSPWLPRLNGQELAAYMKEIRQRKPEWLQFVKDWRARNQFEELKPKLLRERGFVGPFDLLDLQLQSDLLSDPRRFAALQDHPAWLTGALDGAAAVSEASMDDTVRTSRLGTINVELQRSELAREFRRIEREALANMQHTDQQAAAAIKVEPENKTLTDQMSKHKQVLSGTTLAHVDKACQQLLQAKHVATGQPLFPGISVIDTFEARYTQAREIVADIERTAQDQREARQTAYAQWLRETLVSLHPEDQEIDAIIKTLRNEHQNDPSSSQLAALITDFLGLPGSSSRDLNNTSGGDSSQSTAFKRKLSSELFNTRVKEGPPTTHPGAGIGYLRTNAHMENHPVFGPQARHSPVLSRVVRPRQSWLGGSHQAKLGVGGFVTDDPKIGSSSDARRNLLALNDPDRLAAAMDASQQGGNKLWVEPTHATVDERGKIHISVLRAEGEGVAVKTGQVRSILAAKRATLTGPRYSGFSPAHTPGDVTAP